TAPNPAVAIAPVLVPFLFLYFLRIISPAYLFPGEIIGAMLFTSQNIGNWVLGDSATWRIQLALQDMFVASPLGKVQYLFGIAVSNLMAALPAYVALGIVLALSYPVPPMAWVFLAMAIIVLWLLFSAIGIAISSRIKSRREIWPVGNFVFTALGILSPLYYPVSVLPPDLQKVAYFLPGTYAALFAKGGMGMVPVTSLELATYGLLLGGLAAVGILISVYLYRWRTA
ncbi:MAG: ABC transporter permease, partial [Candidatus Thermoplasmatota archaeon]|nr:ABC transporter permease [Candidatus Thermoplasmatota archaeon]